MGQPLSLSSPAKARRMGLPPVLRALALSAGANSQLSKATLAFLSSPGCGGKTSKRRNVTRLPRLDAEDVERPSLIVDERREAGLSAHIVEASHQEGALVQRAQGKCDDTRNGLRK